MTAPAVSLTPAMIFQLLTGANPKCRLPGWPLLFQAGLYDDAPTEAAAWAAHHEALEAAAEAYGFTPYFCPSGIPEGAGFECWRAAFLSAHAY